MSARMTYDEILSGLLRQKVPREMAERTARNAAVHIDGVPPLEEPRGEARAADPRERMNKTETAFAAMLDTWLRCGEIRRWDFEPEKLRLADRTYYIPDFRVVKNDGEVLFYEVKGHWRDDARVKIKVAAELHPYRFTAVRKKRKGEGGGWAYELIGRDQ